MTTQPDPPTAIDAEVFALIDAVVAACDLGPNPHRWQDDKADKLIQDVSKSITRRLTTARPERADIREAVGDALDDSIRYDERWCMGCQVVSANAVDAITDAVWAVIDKAAGGEG